MQCSEGSRVPMEMHLCSTIRTYTMKVSYGGISINLCRRIRLVALCSITRRSGAIMVKGRLCFVDIESARSCMLQLSRVSNVL